MNISFFECVDVRKEKGQHLVILGASALMSNGFVFDSTCVTLLAKDQQIPVLLWSEMYGIPNQVQLESTTQMNDAIQRR